jgi:hypothetical protein
MHAPRHWTALLWHLPATSWHDMLADHITHELCTSCRVGCVGLLRKQVPVEVRPALLVPVCTVNLRLVLSTGRKESIVVEPDVACTPETTARLPAMLQTNTSYLLVYILKM